MSTLFDKFIAMPNLLEAWEHVRKKGSAGGADNESVKQFAEQADLRLAELQKELSVGSYAPEPYLQILIPEDGAQKRSLGLPLVRDKIVQQALLQIIESIVSAEFLYTNYAYRAGKGPVKAVKRVVHLIQTAKTNYYIKCDIKSFFDTVTHKQVLSGLSNYIKDEKILSLVRMFIRMGDVTRTLEWSDREVGIPQGAILSPLLANLFLHRLDIWMQQQQINYVRYSDDFILLVRHETRLSQFS